jgi:hypothetical protein
MLSHKTQMDEWIYDSSYWIEKFLNAINKSVSSALIYDIRTHIKSFEQPNNKNYIVLNNTTSRIIMYEHIGMFSCWLHLEAHTFGMSYKEQMRNNPTRHGY